MSQKNELSKNAKSRLNRLEKYQLSGDIQKKNLINRFFNIGGNIYLDELKLLQRDLEIFHLKTGDHDIYCLIMVIEMLKMNSHNRERYNLSNDFNRLFRELLNKKDITFFEIRILAIMLGTSDGIDEFFSVTEHLLENLENYALEPECKRVKLSIYHNSVDFLMYVDRHYDTSQYANYNEKLLQYLNNAMTLVEYYDNKYLGYILTLKFGLILQDYTIINSSKVNLKLLNDEAIDKHVEKILKEYNIEY